jgi:hypothetical protein
MLPACCIRACCIRACCGFEPNDGSRLRCDLPSETRSLKRTRIGTTQSQASERLAPLFGLIWKKNSSQLGMMNSISSVRRGRQA